MIKEHEPFPPFWVAHYISSSKFNVANISNAFLTKEWSKEIIKVFECILTWCDMTSIGNSGEHVHSCLTLIWVGFFGVLFEVEGLKL